MNHLEQLPPHSLQAEQAVLGSIIMDPPAIHEILDVVSVGDFYTPNYAEMFRGVVDLHETRKGIDTVNLYNWLQEHGKLDHQMTDILPLVNATPTSINIRSYAITVREHAMRRMIIAQAGYMARCAFDADTSLDEILAATSSALTDATSAVNRGKLGSVKDGLSDLYDKLISLDDAAPVSFPWMDLDRIMESLSTFKKELITVAARPGMGKTSALVDVIRHVARQGQHVAFFSLEMSEEQLLIKMLSGATKIEAKTIRRKTFSDEQQTRLFDAMGRLSTLPIYVDDTTGATVQSISAKCHRLKMTTGLDLVVVDYLQLMETAKRHGNRNEEISDISRGLKLLANELNVPVIAAAQLSRAVEARSDKRPMLSDLRDSGAIEQDSAAVIFIYRDEYYNPDTERPNVAEFIVAKNRFGETGVADLYWDGSSTTFKNLVREEMTW